MDSLSYFAATMFQDRFNQLFLLTYVVTKTYGCNSNLVKLITDRKRTKKKMLMLVHFGINGSVRQIYQLVSLTYDDQ